ncbi:MAG: glycerol-3-phosphate 1-O-acyltransferase PlsY [Candidatus Omnitrophica bacterium]|nr:glycerol-3-phosphate 1-O-acyltransferase PlsY [Candidatus Omnitrophota bacterium]
MANLILFSGIFAAYVIGSIPTGYIFGRVFRGIDIRQFGSGNVGATNTLRVIGRVPGLIVLAIDILKGFLCVTYLAGLFMYLSPVARPELYKVFMGLAAIAGHNWTVFLKFKGGKGVATSAGVVIGLAANIFWLGFLIWLIIFLITGYVSIASIVASVSIPIFTLAFNQSAELTIFMSALCLIIVYKHRSNLRRLKDGEEKKLSLFKKKRP